MTAQVREPPPPVRQLRSEVPGPLMSIVDRLLAKEPRQRFDVPGDLAHALEALAGGNDLPGLLGRAGKSPSGRTSPGEVPATPQTAATAAASTPRDRPSGSRPRSSTSAPLWRRPWWVCVGLGLLVAAAGLTWAVTSWWNNDGGATVEQGGNRAVQPPQGHGMTQGGEYGGKLPPPGPGSYSRQERGMLLMSWKPPSELGKPDLWLFGPAGKRQAGLASEPGIRVIDKGWGAVRALRVTRDPDHYHVQPMFSPDRRRIVFLRADEPDGSSAICVCNTVGSSLRVLVSSGEEPHRLSSPVWISGHLIYYAREPRWRTSPSTEIWQVDPDGRNQQLFFRLRDTLGFDGGVVTDVSPDGHRLAVVAQKGTSSSTADVYTTDLLGNGLRTVYEDKPVESADARATWQPPDGQWIAWQHYFNGEGPAGGHGGEPRRFGVGLARREDRDQWNAKLQPTSPSSVLAIAWCEGGGRSGLRTAR